MLAAAPPPAQLCSFALSLILHGHVRPFTKSFCWPTSPKTVFLLGYFSADWGIAEDVSKCGPGMRWGLGVCGGGSGEVS